MYRVQFENNIAVSSVRVPVAESGELKQLGIEGSKLVMKWCIVDADNEYEAMENANYLVRNTWGSVLRLRKMA